MRKIIILLGVLLGVNVLFSQQEKVIQEVIINGVKKRIFYEGNKMVLDIDKNPIYRLNLVPLQRYPYNTRLTCICVFADA